MHTERSSEPDDEGRSQRLRRVERVYRSGLLLNHYIGKFGIACVRNPGVILDVGAGDSTFAAEVADDPDLHATAIAVEPGFVLRGPKNKFGLPVSIADVPRVAAFGQDLPFRDSSVPRAVSHMVFEHLSRQEAQHIVQEVLRVLQPHGTYGIDAANMRTRFRVRRGFEPLHYRRKVLTVTKPEDYDNWAPEKQQALTQEAAKIVSCPLWVHWIRRGMYRMIQTKRLNGYT